MERIFVQIAGQWSTAHQATLDELFAHASSPQRIFVGYAHDADSALNLPPGIEKKQVRRVHTLASKSDFGHARAVQLYGYEEYVLSLAEGARFVPDWDERLLAAFQACGSDKAILAGISGQPARFEATGFSESGELLLRRKTMAEDATAPLRGAFLAWGDFFARGTIIDDVLRHINSVGTEQNLELSVRAFMSGYDVFHPHVRLLECAREDMQMLSTVAVDTAVASGKEDTFFGKQRRMSQFEELAGIDVGVKRITSVSASDVERIATFAEEALRRPKPVFYLNSKKRYDRNTIVNDALSGVLIMRGYLEQSVCQDLVHYASNLESQMNSEVSLNGMASEIINIFNDIYAHRVGPFFGKTIARYEFPQLLRYTEGDKYESHADSEISAQDASVRLRLRERDYSVMLYLNDDAAGGGLHFMTHDYTVQPEAGMLVAFPSDHRYLHEAKNTTVGTRYALVSWAATVDSASAKIQGGGAYIPLLR
jgi:hypothetical protein